jgi:hypothetical protein
MGVSRVSAKDWSCTMRSNIGVVDRAVRLGLGLALLSLVFVGPKTLWGLVGLIPLITGLARFCPAYGIAGVSSCSACADDKEEV